MARKRFEFWLNDQRDDDWDLYTIIQKLKKPSKGQGQFTRAIREGIRLWVSLRDGQIDVLLELFPWVREAIAKSTPEPVSSGGGQLDEIKNMLEMIAAQQQSNNGYVMKSAAPAKPLSAPTATVKQTTAAVSAETIADNFLSMFQ